MYPRLEATLRASHDKSNPTGVSRWDPNNVTLDDDDEPLPEYGPSNAGMSNPNNRHDGRRVAALENARSNGERERD